MRKGTVISMIALLVSIVGLLVALIAYFKRRNCVLCDDLDDELVEYYGEDDEDCCCEGCCCEDEDILPEEEAEESPAAMIPASIRVPTSFGMTFSAAQIRTRWGSSRDGFKLSTATDCKFR